MYRNKSSINVSNWGPLDLRELGSLLHFKALQKVAGERDRGTREATERGDCPTLDLYLRSLADLAASLPRSLRSVHEMCPLLGGLIVKRSHSQTIESRLRKVAAGANGPNGSYWPKSSPRRAPIQNERDRLLDAIHIILVESPDGCVQVLRHLRAVVVNGFNQFFLLRRDRNIYLSCKENLDQP
ncbi:hypothetical protein COLO4_03968 [Corchorus olitorius]|uniref:Uncharacterized protein n=1 Tax=Corchorus olitorius TaxID=93759 RepID=A0A1R3KVV9_9ROSI|nr:hypothetical protein COLO4_03968 [Corchorus olitorius]